MILLWLLLLNFVIYIKMKNYFLNVSVYYNFVYYGDVKVVGDFIFSLGFLGFF